MKKTFTQIKILAVASLVCFSYYFSNAQCNNANIFGTSTAPAPQNTVTAVTGMWATEYHQVNGLVAGNVYQVSSSIPTDFLTIRHTTSNGPVVAFGTTPVAFTAPVSGTYFFHVNTNSSCGTNTSNRNLVLANNTIIGAALNFAGGDDRVNLGTGITTSLTGSTKVSVEAWVKPTSLSGLGCIVGNYNTGATGLQVLLRRANNQYYEFWIGNGTAWFNTNSVATPTLNVWQHVAATWNGTVASIYVNGVLSGTTTPGITSLGNGASNPVLLGGNTMNEVFIGDIDEVRIWNEARTQCEINTYKNCEIPTTGTGLLANYHFNQGIDAANNTTVTTLTDASGSGFTGTLTNMALTTGTISNWVTPGGVISGSVTPANLAITVGSTVTNSVICSGNSTTLSGSGANTYVWTSGVTDAVAFTPTVTNTYTVTGTNTLTGCTNTAVSSVTVNSLPTLTVNSGAICAGQSFTMVPSGADTYTYSNGSSVATPTANATYSVSGTNTLTGCVSNVDAESSVTVNALPSISVNSGSICAGQSFTMVPSGADTYTYSNGSSVATPSANATYSVSGTNTLTGCVSNVDAISSVTVNAIPTISVTSGSICAGQSFTMVPSGATTYTFSNGSSVATPTANATYTVNGTDANGCVSSVEAISSVTVNALPVLTAVTNNTLLCIGETATLTVSGTATSYTWSTTNNTTAIVVTPSVQTTYTVEGTGANGCLNSTTITQNVSACTGIESLTNVAAINVYPNPNNGLFVIELITTSKVIVTNSLGQVVNVETFEAGKHTININNESTGVYFVKVIENNNQQIIKVIKE